MDRLRLGVAFLLAFVACDQTPERREATPEPSVVTSSSPTPVEPACANQQRVVDDRSSRIGGVLEADVDGDGEPDEVYVAMDRNAEVGCQAFVVAATGTEVLAAPVWETGPDGGLPQPRIVALIDANGEEGSEIVVSERAGASTEFVGLFVVTDGVLARVTVDAPADQDVAEDLFAYGGSVGHIEGVGCEGPGTIVSSFAVPGESPGDLEKGIYNVERRLYVFEGSTLIDAGIQQEQVPLEELEQFPEFASGPFGTCEGAG